MHIKGGAGDILKVFSLAVKEVFICARLFPVSCRLQYLLKIHLNISILMLPSLTLYCLWLSLGIRPSSLACFSGCSHLLNALQQMLVIVFRFTMPLQLRLLCNYAWRATSIHMPSTVVTFSVSCLLVYIFSSFFDFFFNFLIYSPLRFSIAHLSICFPLCDYLLYRLLPPCLAPFFLLLNLP